MRRALLLAALLALVPASADAARIYAVSQTELVWFDSAAPSVEIGSVPLTGVGSGEAVKGLDWEPYGPTFVLFTKQGTTGRLYDLDPVTGVASDPRTLFASPFDATDPYTGLAGSEFGFDISPETGSVRIVSATDQNLRVSADGAVATEPALSPAGQGIAAVAYTNPYADLPGESDTALFGYGYNTDEVYLQAPENDGTLVSQWTSTTPAQDSADLLHMDIAPDRQAFLTLRNSGDQRLLEMSPLTSGPETDLGSTALQSILGMAAVNNVASVATTDVHVGESAGTADLVFERAAPFDTESAGANVQVSTASGSATAPVDYEPTATIVPFEQGSATTGFSVPITDDTAEEPDETFTLTIDNGPNTPVAAPLVATVTIHDDDAPKVTETRTETRTETVVQTQTVLRQPPPIVLLLGRCANVKAGTAADDALPGTTAGDRLTGLGGADGLAGLGGDDCLDGGAGGDLLSGGDGADELKGGSGENVVYGGAGADTISVRNRRRDVVDCGTGRDTVTADRRDRLRRCERVTRRR